jgi:hypothetical protein
MGRAGLSHGVEFVTLSLGKYSQNARSRKAKVILWSERDHAMLTLTRQLTGSLNQMVHHCYIT